MLGVRGGNRQYGLKPKSPSVITRLSLPPNMSRANLVVAGTATVNCTKISVQNQSGDLGHENEALVNSADGDTTARRSLSMLYHASRDVIP